MSAVEGGPASGGLPPNTIIAIGVIGGLAGIYLTMLNQTFNTTIFSVMGAIGSIFAVVWGADAVRRVCSYGLGTGVPSIGMVALGMGVVAAIFGLILPETGILPIPAILGPVISFIVAALIGLVIGSMSNKILKMNIPIMEKSMIEIAGAGCLVMMGLSASIAGSFAFNDAILPGVVSTGYIAIVFIGGAMTILHPFNANLGPDESQYRTLYVAVEKAALTMVIAGFASLTVIDTVSAAVTMLVGLLIFLVYFNKFMKSVHREAYKVVGTGLLPTAEELG
ncbi:MAG: tetrahydromethanopterin S-methyltransferase subunit C [Methanosarcinales archaeon]|nr:tetrahydromethanopterin S-methyltransferase subunit C [Methanosarcinales archaeon]MCD4841340.1 tetrahydromethanopterin S-methyltransferase subunit C [Methanosarcinales archaeon]